MISTQAVLLVKHRAHQIGSAQDALHQEVGFSLGTHGHGLGRAVLVGIAGDDLVVGRGFTQAGQHRLDLFLMSHKNGRGNTLPAGLDHSLDNRLVVGRRHGDNAGLSAFGRRDDAVDRVYHIRSSCTISFAV